MLPEQIGEKENQRRQFDKGWHVRQGASTGKALQKGRKEQMFLSERAQKQVQTVTKITYLILHLEGSTRARVTMSNRLRDTGNGRSVFASR